MQFRARSELVEEANNGEHNVLNIKQIRYWLPIVILNILLGIPQQVNSAVQEEFRHTAWNNKNEKKEIDPTKKAHIQNVYGKLPLSFEKNEGQADSKVKFLSQGQGYSLFLTPTESVLTLTKPIKDQKPATEKHRKKKTSRNMNHQNSFVIPRGIIKTIRIEPFPQRVILKRTSFVEPVLSKVEGVKDLASIQIKIQPRTKPLPSQ